MKHATLSLLALLPAMLFFGSMKAQTPVVVCQAEFFDPLGNGRGKIAKVGNALVVIDDVDLKASFSIDKSSIKSWADQRGILTITTTRPITYRQRVRPYFEFRWINESCDRIMQWLPKAPVAPPSLQKKTYRVTHKRSLGRSADGTLTISDRMIEFECSTDSTRSRQWELKDIKVEQNGPYVLEVFPFRDDKYTFEFLGKGLEVAEFKALKAAILKARGPR